MNDRPAPATVGVWRALRGGVVGAAATVLAVGGHVAAGGAPPTPLVTTAVAVLLGAAGITLSHSTWTLPRLLALLLGAQASLHAVFVLSPPALGAPHAAPHAIDHATTNLLPSSPSMVVGHLLAAAGTAALLRRGESWLYGVLDAFALRAVRLLGSRPAVYGACPHPVPVTALAPPVQRLGADTTCERGPPR